MNYNLISDDTRVKDVFMLKVPTDAPRDLMYLWDYQLTVLNSIRVDDEQLELENNQNVEAVEWLRPSNLEKASDLMCVYMGPKYVQPRIMVSAPAVIDSTQDVAARHDTYDPRFLSDYGGALFNHTLAKLVQRYIVDEEGKLTPPWLEYDKLRTGTVVLMRISLCTYSITASYSQKKFYQIYADRIKVLMPSYEPIDTRSIRLSIDDYTRNEEGQKSDNEQQRISESSTTASSSNASPTTPPFSNSSHPEIASPVEQQGHEEASSASGLVSFTTPSTSVRPSVNSSVKQAKTSGKKSANKHQVVDDMNLD
ncbi:hypothetical protein F5887DRAFT_1288229 [Amanita rubescens]|nr:hypothetical protein F5887DRAFT_1288229 [Amanita rubescens]